MNHRLVDFIAGALQFNRREVVLTLLVAVIVQLWWLDSFFHRRAADNWKKSGDKIEQRLKTLPPKDATLRKLHEEAQGRTTASTSLTP
jgi:hypothetical protein